jgi:hypothetical protein
MKGSSFWRVGLIVVLLLLTAIAIYLLRPRDFLLTYCSIGLLVISAFGVASFRQPRLRNVFLVLGSISLVTGLLDPFTYKTDRQVVHSEGTWNSTYHFLWDDNMGVALPPNVVARSRKFTADSVVYDATYTIDADGHRQTIGSADPAADDVIFVGGSYVFGEGVQDNEALPQQFSDLTAHRFHVANLGVSTYGVHQMLRSMELGLLDKFLTDGKRYFVYSGDPDHAHRAASSYDWALRGPSYALQPDGTVKFVGQMQSVWGVYAIAIANRSVFLRTYATLPLLTGFSPDAVPLYVALVRQTAAMAKEKYGAKFIILFWDAPGNRLSDNILAAFDKAHIAYVRISSILPGYAEDSAKYRVSHFDEHPNALADRLIAEYLIHHLDDFPPQP